MEVEVVLFTNKTIDERFLQLHNLSLSEYRGSIAFPKEYSHDFMIWKLRLILGHFGFLISPNQQIGKEASLSSDVLHPGGIAATP